MSQIYKSGRYTYMPTYLGSEEFNARCNQLIYNFRHYDHFCFNLYSLWRINHLYIYSQSQQLVCSIYCMWSIPKLLYSSYIATQLHIQSCMYSCIKSEHCMRFSVKAMCALASYHIMWSIIIWLLQPHIQGVGGPG